MAQRQPEENANLAQVLKLVDQLSPEDREELYRQLDLKAWGDRWRALCARVDEHNKNQTPLTEEEIVAEMKEIRKEIQAKRAQSGN